MGRWAGFALIAFTLAVIAAGLWQVGGPEQARAEQRDEKRMDDLFALSEHLSCVKRRDGGADVVCGDMPSSVDRFTNVPYAIEYTRVCAVFERVEVVGNRFGRQFEGGCLTIN